jgi:hypothetical protein
MISISTRGRVGGIPARVQLLDELLGWASKHPAVVMRKDGIARFALPTPRIPREA